MITVQCTDTELSLVTGLVGAPYFNNLDCSLECNGEVVELQLFKVTVPWKYLESATAISSNHETVNEYPSLPGHCHESKEENAPLRSKNREIAEIPDTHRACHK